MKIKHLFITAILACHVIPHQTNAVSSTRLAVAIPTLYAGAKLIQSNGDIARVQRSARKDRDVTCDHMIRIINTNCNHDLCKEIVSAIKKLRTTPSQQTHDAIQDALQTAKETPAGIEIEKAINEYHEVAGNLHQSVIDKINEINKPKK